MNSISFKLFFAFLALTIFVLLFSLGLAWWGLSVGFYDYRKSQELGRLKAMHDPLVELYQHHGSQWPQDVERYFDSIVSDYLPHKRGKRRKPRNDYLEKADSGEFEERDRTHNARHRSSPRKRGGFDKKTALTNKEGDLLAGSNMLALELDHVSLDLISEGDKIGEIKASVGFLTYNKEEEDFIEKQAWSSLVIALIALFLAGITSWRISRVFLTPIYQLRSYVNQLSSGKYDQCLEGDHTDELSELISGVNQLATTLEQNRDTRKRWVADVSHELRTPVTILHGEIVAMLDGVRDINTEGVQSLKHEIERISLLIDDLYQLSLSEVGGLRYEFETINLTSIALSLTRSFQTKVKDKGLTIAVDFNEDLVIEADSNRIEQLFLNLLNNSIAYTDAPGSIVISSSLATSNSVIIVFEDSAPAVGVSDLNQLFEPLYRSEESRNRRMGGAGLGMSICDNIVKAHGGQMSASVSEMGGLKITVTLPIKRET